MKLIRKVNSLRILSRKTSVPAATAGEVRGLAKRVKDAAQARRLLPIAAMLGGGFIVRSR
jgi:hypothetical protein